MQIWLNAAPIGRGQGAFYISAHEAVFYFQQKLHEESGIPKLIIKSNTISHISKGKRFSDFEPRFL